MGTVVVDYNFSNYKAKVLPSTVLNDVLVESLKHFKLLDDESQNTAQGWLLLHNDKPVTLDLPWRLMNLSTGVKMELKKSETEISNSSSGVPKLVRIKLQVTNHKTIIEDVDIYQNVKEILDELALQNNWPLDPQDTMLQVFSKKIPYVELQHHTLSSLGIKDSALLRIILPNSTPSAQIMEIESLPEKEHNTKTEDEASIIAKTRKMHEMHKISAFVPSETPLLSQINRDLEEDYELTVDQARRYQQMLTKQIGTLGGPLMSKRMREQKEGEQLKTKITECILRIRFADQTHIEVSFRPDEDMQTVYKVVSKSFIDEQLRFNLCQSHPYKVLPPDEKQLVDDLGFGSKTLLLFQSESEGPYLKSTILNEAKGLTEADDVKLDRLEAPTTKIENKDEEYVPSPKIKTASSLSGSTKKVPRWLKLSKK